MVELLESKGSGSWPGPHDIAGHAGGAAGVVGDTGVVFLENHGRRRGTGERF